MPAEAGRPLAIHATAVAIGERALLIRGPSHAGKSRLALALIAHASPDTPVHLIGDDRILLHPVAGSLMARPHPRIGGFIERRGLGIVAMPWVAEARLGGVVDLDRRGAHRAQSGVSDATSGSDCSFCFGHSTRPGHSHREPRDDAVWRLPRLTVACPDETDRVKRVLAWWAGLAATWAQHPRPKAGGTPLADEKD